MTSTPSISLNDEKKTAEIEHLEHASNPAIFSEFNHYPDFSPELKEQANRATEAEHNATFSYIFKNYYSSILWSMLFSATIIMEGYDNILMSSFFGYPSFARRFGELNPDGVGYDLTGPWQVGLGCAAAAGSFIGVICNGYLTERWGHRNVILVSLVFMAAFIFLPFFAQNNVHLVVGQVLCGLPWGVFATMGPSYASEVIPLKLRGHLAAYTNICWATGQFIAAGVLQGLENYGAGDPIKSQWSYRIPFAIQWVWVPPLFIMTYLAPDSPQWLIRKGRLDDAYKALNRLTSVKISETVPDRLAMMRYTHNLELDLLDSDESNSKGWKQFLECFKGANLRRTEIGCIAFSGQVLSGSSFAYSPSYFFKQAGLATEKVYKLNLGTTAIAWVGTAVSWYWLAKFGRRTIYIFGYTILTFLLLLVGILACPVQTTGIKWAQAGLTMLWVATYAQTIGPLAFTIVGEASSTRLRPQSIALARGAYTLCSLFSNIIEPYLINTTEADLKGKTAFVWFGTAFIVWIWAIFRLPETRDRTYEELDILFERKISARKFHKTDLGNIKGENYSEEN